MKRGSHMSEESRVKISASLMGRTLSLETRARMSVAQMGNTKSLGYHHSEETKAKMSAAQTEYMCSPEARAKVSAAGMGHVVSPEARAKMSAWQKCKPKSPEWCAKMGAAHWKGGRKVTLRKANAKRRLLGFNALNLPFAGCEGHHINPQDVIYMLKTLHRSVKHNVWTGRNMEKINALAYEWLGQN